MKRRRFGNPDPQSCRLPAQPQPQPWKPSEFETTFFKFNTWVISVNSSTELKGSPDNTLQVEKLLKSALLQKATLWPKRTHHR